MRERNNKIQAIAMNTLVKLNIDFAISFKLRGERKQITV